MSQSQRNNKGNREDENMDKSRRIKFIEKMEK